MQFSISLNKIARFTPTPIEQAAIEASLKKRSVLSYILFKHIFDSRPDRREVIQSYMPAISKAGGYHYGSYQLRDRDPHQVERLLARIQAVKERRAAEVREEARQEREQMASPPPYNDAIAEAAQRMLVIDTPENTQHLTN